MIAGLPCISRRAVSRTFCSIGTDQENEINVSIKTYTCILLVYSICCVCIIKIYSFSSQSTSIENSSSVKRSSSFLSRFRSGRKNKVCYSQLLVIMG